jgi:hypothetical protein
MTRPGSLVLHALRCIGFASLPRLAVAAGLPEAEVDSELIDLAVAGLVTHAAGDFGGWGLTDAGRTADAEWTADELATAGTRTGLVEAYNGFLVLNPELLDLCTAWQLRSANDVMVTNDHTDPVYDARVLHRFTEFDQRADVVCAGLAAAMPRLRRYRVRLTDALVHVRCGALDYLADNTESYHAVWFQLHEDLLSTLDIPRW